MQPWVSYHSMYLVLSEPEKEYSVVWGAQLMSGAGEKAEKGQSSMGSHPHHVDQKSTGRSLIFLRENISHSLCISVFIT